MRCLVLFLSTALLLASSGRSAAQEKVKWVAPRIEKVDVGFQIHRDNLEQTAYKAGLWTPIYVVLFGGTDGIKKEKDKDPPYLSIESYDSDDVGTKIRVPVDVDPMQTRSFIGYVKTGHVSISTQDITVQLHIHNQRPIIARFTPAGTLSIDAQLYLTVGSRMPIFNNAIRRYGLPPGAKVDDDFNFGLNRMRQAVYLKDVENLPPVWFGYDCVDMMILSTESKRFLNDLSNQPERLKAIAEWVRRGGRLVIPIARLNQPEVSALLKKDLAWAPPIPVVPPGTPQPFQVERLVAAETFAGAQDVEPFDFKDKANTLQRLPIHLATLDPGNVPAGDWEILETADKKPVIARVPYGLGQIIYFAFSFEDTPFAEWKGHEKFLQKVAEKLAPRSIGNFNPNMGMRFQDQNLDSDLATQMIRNLEDFDVKVIPFGYVALFIILYILVVGPLDFFLLKYVFKRLEWTWITFPSVVVAVSVIAYFAAYALKGRDMKINKIDIVDFDLRTSLDENRKPKDAHAYGRSFFTILSPRIQNYTVGLEPNVVFWGEKAGNQKSVDVMSWLGRPSGGMNNMGRSGAGGSFFRKPYEFTEDAAGMRGVPIPVWTTKAFTGSWEETLPKMPFVADLVYHGKKRITGTLENHLGADLIDAWLIYDKKCFPLGESLKSVKLGATPQPIDIFDRADIKDIDAWTHLGSDDKVPDLRFNPTAIVRQILFHEHADTRNTGRNHLLRPLDLGWRVRPAGLTGTQEAILYARVKMASDAAEAIARNDKSPVPTKLWLGDIPERGRAGAPPALAGLMNQCTVIRVILPINPAKD